jgi:hypothetical protein
MHYQFHVEVSGSLWRSTLLLTRHTRLDTPCGMFFAAVAAEQQNVAIFDNEQPNLATIPALGASPRTAAGQSSLTISTPPLLHQHIVCLKWMLVVEHNILASRSIVETRL